MKRRELVTLIGATAAWPLVARAQQPDRMWRVGVLMGQAASDSVYQSALAALIQLLQPLGWIEDRTVRFDIRWGAGNADNIRNHATELVALTPDVILVS